MGFTGEPIRSWYPSPLWLRWARVAMWVLKTKQKHKRQVSLKARVHKVAGCTGARVLVIH